MSQNLITIQAPGLAHYSGKLSKFLYNILYTVSTQQHQYSDIMYAIGYTVATCFDRKRSSSDQ